MNSKITEAIAELYTRRHNFRDAVYGDKPYANVGYWPRAGMTLLEACDALTDLVVTAAGIGPGDRVLEVGCGYGASAVTYTRRYRPASVIGIDVTEIRIQTGREYLAQQGLADVIELRLGNATALEFADQQFTKVVAVECAFHFDTRRDFFREAARVLVPGGRLALSDVIPRRGVDPADFVKRSAPVLSEACLDVAANAYDADGYAQHLRAAGFDNIRIEVITEQTIPHFCNWLERLAVEIGPEKGKGLMHIAARQREHVAAGAEYVLVAAERK